MLNYQRVVRHETSLLQMKLGINEVLEHVSASNSWVEARQIIANDVHFHQQALNHNEPHIRDEHINITSNPEHHGKQSIKHKKMVLNGWSFFLSSPHCGMSQQSRRLLSWLSQQKSGKSLVSCINSQKWFQDVSGTHQFNKETSTLEFHSTYKVRPLAKLTDNLVNYGLWMFMGWHN